MSFVLICWAGWSKLPARGSERLVVCCQAGKTLVPIFLARLWQHLTRPSGVKWLVQITSPQFQAYSPCITIKLGLEKVKHISMQTRMRCGKCQNPRPNPFCQILTRLLSSHALSCTMCSFKTISHILSIFPPYQNWLGLEKSKAYISAIQGWVLRCGKWQNPIFLARLWQGFTCLMPNIVHLLTNPITLPFND